MWFVWYILMTRMRLWVFGGNIIGECPSQSITSRGRWHSYDIIANIDFDQTVLAKIIPRKIAIFLFLYCIHWKWVTKFNPYSKVWAYWHSAKKTCLWFSTFTYSIIHLYQCKYMYIYFILMVIIQYYIILFIQIVLALATELPLDHLLYTYDKTSFLFFF